MKTKDIVSTAVVVKSIEKESSPLFKKLSAIEKITDSIELDRVGDNIKALKELVKIADKKEREITDPLKQALAATVNLFKPFRGSVADIEKKFKGLIIDYHNTQEKKIASLEKDFEEGKIKKPTTLMDKVAELKIGSSSSIVRLIWKAECLNVAMTPKEFLVPDEQAITKALKDGRKIAGWEWKQIKSISI